jgi:hypothetical protein
VGERSKQKNDKGKNCGGSHFSYLN